MKQVNELQKNIVMNFRDICGPCITHSLNFAVYYVVKVILKRIFGTVHGV